MSSTRRYTELNSCSDGPLEVHACSFRISDFRQYLGVWSPDSYLFWFRED